MHDLLKDDLFSTTSLTDSINQVPNTYGRLQELGVFGAPKGVRSTTITVELNRGVLSLIQNSDRRDPPGAAPKPKRGLKSFQAFHLTEEEPILPEDVQGVRKYGSDNEMEAVEDVVNDRLADAARRHHITWEHLRMGALKGEILDADGSVLIDLFNEFDIAEPVFGFNFAGASDPAQSSRSIYRHMEDNLVGEVMTGVHALCSEEFMDGLLADEAIKRAYDRQQDTDNPQLNDVRKGFKWQGILWEEYRGSASYRQPDGTYATRRFIPAGEVRFFPTGTQSTFRHYNAPGNFMDAVNTLGEPLYARRDVRKYEGGIDILTESNPLPICLRPQLLVRGTI